MGAARNGSLIAVRASCFALWVLCAANPAVGQGRDSGAAVALDEQRRTCSDDESLRILRLWMDELPAESRTGINDPVVRQATRSHALTPTKELRAGAKRIFLKESITRGGVDRAALAKKRNALQREFKTVTFPHDLEQALQGDDEGSRLYIAAALRLVKRVPTQDCSELFRTYLIKQDERLAFVPTWIVQFGNNYGLQQVVRGTEDDAVVFTAPKAGCSPTPEVPEFFNIQKNGRAAGKYSSLGFPEVVAIALFDASGAALGTCTGVMLDARWVLTAAHCINDGTQVSDDLHTEVMLNEKVARLRDAAGLPYRSKLKGAARIPIEYMNALKDTNMRPHERGKLDVALLELAVPLTIDRPASRDVLALPGAILATLTGYGATLDQPAASAANPPLDVGWLNVSVTDTLISWKASEQRGSSGADLNASCPGDSGAPIYVSVKDSMPVVDLPAVGCIDESRRLIGIVSYGQSVGRRLCLASSSGAGPRLLPHMPWICREANLFC